jgi:hypothetical protein
MPPIFAYRISVVKSSIFPSASTAKRIGPGLFPQGGRDPAKIRERLRHSLEVLVHKVRDDRAVVQLGTGDFC